MKKTLTTAQRLDKVEKSVAAIEKMLKKMSKEAEPKAPVKTKVSVKLADYEPCKRKDNGAYVWGGKSGYRARRTAYCYAVCTKGASNKFEKGFEFDEKAWNKAKTEFGKKFVYVKTSEQ